MKSRWSFALGMFALLALGGGVRGQSNSNDGDRGGIDPVSGTGSHGIVSANGGDGTRGGIVIEDEFGGVGSRLFSFVVTCGFERGLVPLGHGVGNGLAGKKMGDGRVSGEKGDNEFAKGHEGHR